MDIENCKGCRYEKSVDSEECDGCVRTEDDFELIYDINIIHATNDYYLEKD